MRLTVKSRESTTFFIFAQICSVWYDNTQIFGLYELIVTDEVIVWWILTVSHFHRSRNLTQTILGNAMPQTERKKRGQNRARYSRTQSKNYYNKQFKCPKLKWIGSYQRFCALRNIALPRFVIKKLVESHYCCRLSFSLHSIHKVRGRALAYVCVCVYVCRARAFIRALNCNWKATAVITNNNNNKNRRSRSSHSVCLHLAHICAMIRPFQNPYKWNDIT